VDDRRKDSGLRGRNVRLAVLLGIVAVAVYAAFFLIKGMGAS